MAVAGSISPEPNTVYINFDCNEPSECHVLFVNITSVHIYDRIGIHKKLIYFNFRNILKSIL